MKSSLLKYSVVVPVYRSGKWMDELVERIGTVMNQEARGAFELILVNDCSPDAITWPAIQRNAQKYPWVRGYDLLYNVGQFKATICGLQQAQADLVINMDDDLQHLPEEIPKLMRAMEADADILCVMGRYETTQQNALRVLGSRFFQRIMRSVYGKPAHIQTTSFRIMRRELVDVILTFRTAKPIIGALIVTLTRKIKNVPVRHAARGQGVSGYTWSRLIRTTVDNVVNASTAPLRFFSMVGFSCAAISFVLGAFFFSRWLAGGVGVAGFTSQILLIIFFGGMTLAGIGVLGEYVARIISEVTGPEKFRIKDRTPGAGL